MTSVTQIMSMFNVDRQTAQEIFKLVRREELIDDDFARGGAGGDFLQFLPPSYGSDTSSIYNPVSSSSSSSRGGGKEFLKRVMPWPFLFVWSCTLTTLLYLCININEKRWIHWSRSASRVQNFRYRSIDHVWIVQVAGELQEETSSRCFRFSVLRCHASLLFIFHAVVQRRWWLSSSHQWRPISHTIRRGSIKKVFQR